MASKPVSVPLVFLILTMLVLTASPSVADHEDSFQGNVRHKEDYSAGSCNQFVVAGGADAPETRACSLPVKVDAGGRIQLDRLVGPAATTLWSIRAEFDAWHPGADGPELRHRSVQWNGASVLGVQFLGTEPPLDSRWTLTGMVPNQLITVHASLVANQNLPVPTETGFWGVLANWPDVDPSCSLIDSPQVLLGDDDCVHYTANAWYGNYAAAKDAFNP